MSVPIASTAKIMRKRFGRWLKEVRVTAGLTQLDVAAALDYAYPTTVSQIERGASALPPGELFRWAEAIKMSPQEVAEKYLYFIEPFLYIALTARIHILPKVFQNPSQSSCGDWLGVGRETVPAFPAPRVQRTR